MKYIRHTLLALLMLAPLCAIAQGSIDNVVNSLEKSKSVTNEVYSERRDPKTKNVIKSSRVFHFTDNKIASRLIEAIKKERNKATSFQMNNRSHNAVYTINFEGGKGLKAKYTLVQHGESVWILSVEKYTGSSRHDRSEFIEDVDFDFDCCPDNGNYTTYTVTNSGSTITVTTRDQIHNARQQAKVARKQAKAAREQARQAREQARVAREQAREQARAAREQARQAREQAKEAREQAKKIRENAKNLRESTIIINGNSYSI